MSEYTKSDARAMLSDTFLEVSELSYKVTELSKHVRQLSEDIEAITRHLDDFETTITDTRTAIIQDIAKNIATASATIFSEHLTRIESLFKQLPTTQKSGYFLRFWKK